VSERLSFMKLFSTGPALVVAVDHGLFDGPIVGLERIDEVGKSILPEADCVLMSAGVFRHLRKPVFGHRNAPQPIVRINWSTIYCFSWNYHSGDTVEAFSPREIQRMGASIVLISLSLCTGSEKRDAENVKIFADLCSEAHDLGMTVVGEYFPVNDEKLTQKQMYEEVKIGCRVLFELGADVIKTFHTLHFEKVVEGCPIPILTLGGKRAKSDLAALKMAEEQVKSGSAGVVFGRNIVQADDPMNLQRALLDVLKKRMPAGEAAKKYGLR